MLEVFFFASSDSECIYSSSCWHFYYLKILELASNVFIAEIRNSKYNVLAKYKNKKLSFVGLT